jgi:hypothetical protein
MNADDNVEPALPEQEFLTVQQTAESLNISASIAYGLRIGEEREAPSFALHHAQALQLPLLTVG